MRFWDGDDQGVQVTWYWCAPGAQPAPYNLFASGNWSSDPIWPWLGVGEIKGAPRTWYNGANPWGWDGSHFCGSKEAWEAGLDSQPGPQEWVWCCTTWPSNPRLCFLRTPATENPVVAPSYAEPLPELPLFGRPWQSEACLCVLPSSALPALPASSGYGVSAPTELPAVRASVCLCFAPSSALPALPARSGYGVSAPTELPAVRASVCLCFAPASKIQALVPSAYGYGSGPSSESVTARVCLCFAPSATVALQPASYPYGSYPTKPAGVTSSVCLCVDPRSTIGTLAPSLYASGGSYGGAATGVFTPCCPGKAFPLRLYLQFDGGSPGEPCACLNGRFPLDWSPDGWISGQINPCGVDPLRITLSCSNDPALCGPPKPWLLVVTDVATGQTQSVCGSFDCASLVGSFNFGPVLIGQCSNVDFTPVLVTITP
jgi:hypothetical protein